MKRPGMLTLTAGPVSREAIIGWIALLSLTNNMVCSGTIWLCSLFALLVALLPNLHVLLTCTALFSWIIQSILTGILLPKLGEEGGLKKMLTWHQCAVFVSLRRSPCIVASPDLLCLKWNSFQCDFSWYLDLNPGPWPSRESAMSPWLCCTCWTSH